jgi:hypothetical protein
MSLVDAAGRWGGLTDDRLHRRVAVSGLLAMLMAGCTDGYPPPQREPVEPQLMSTGQLLKSLNTMGRRAADGSTWTYRLTGACELMVGVESGASRGETLYPLSGARFQLGYDKALSAYEVQAMLAGAQAPAERPVLKTTDWADAVFANSVLWHLQQDCA